MNRGLWIMLCVLTSISVGVSCVVLVTVNDVDSLSIEVLISITRSLNLLVPFALGLYLMLTLQRWWSLRSLTLGQIFHGLVNVAMLFACVASASDFAVERELVCRYGMLSVFLFSKAAIGDSFLQDLINRKILDKDEADCLFQIGLFQRPMVMWAWIMRIIYDTCVGLGTPPSLISRLITRCLEARDGVQHVHTMLCTQLPYAYVHLITVLVNVSNLTMAVQCGVSFAISYSKDDTQTLIYDAVLLVLVPTLYYGLLS